MPLRLRRQPSASVTTPPPGYVTMFVDEMGHLRLKDEDGLDLYVVLTTNEPHPGQPLNAPINYYRRRERALPAPPVPKALPPSTLWDHLTHDD